MHKNTKTSLKVLKLIGLIILLYTFSSIPILFLHYFFKIDYTTWKDIYFYLYCLICNILFLGLLLFIYRKDLKKDFQEFFKKEKLLDNLEFAFKYWLLGFGIMIISNLIISILNQGGIAGNEQSVRSLIKTVPWYMAFNVSIYAPFTEELIFRKCVREIETKQITYILISGLLFGFLHITGNINSPIDYLYLIPYSSLGIAFAYTYYKSNNIFSTICMHSFHNTMAFIILILGSII